jgi:hypothetical protein
MAIDLASLARGQLVYSVREAALDDVRFERILRGFADHYLITNHSLARFEFERGEGYLRAGRFDAFGLVDGGSVERLRDTSDSNPPALGNVIQFAPRFGWLRLTLNLRVTFAVWLILFVTGLVIVGGDWLAWLVGLVGVWTITIILVQLSLKAKIRRWLARESWN